MQKKPPLQGLLAGLQQRLANLGLQPLVETLFEPGSPVALLSAQALYLSAPVLSFVVPMSNVHRLAAALEAEAGEAGVKIANDDNAHLDETHGATP